MTHTANETTANRPPLWRVMVDAHADAFRQPNMRGGLQKAKAAEIRALRDWLVPEEAPCPEMATPLRDQRQDIRAILTAEADRAERGQ